jgi:hypothetical protein
VDFVTEAVVLSSSSSLFQQHTGRVFRLQFDEFQIVSSSHDDTILIWDFLNCAPSELANSLTRAIPGPIPGLGGSASSSSNNS